MAGGGDSAASGSNISEVAAVMKNFMELFNKEQAEALMQGLNLAHSHPAVLYAIDSLRNDVDNKFNAVDAKFSAVDSKMDAGFSVQRTELSAIKSVLDIIKWGVGIMAAGMVGLLLKAVFTTTGIH